MNKNSLNPKCVSTHLANIIAVLLGNIDWTVLLFYLLRRHIIIPVHGLRTKSLIVLILSNMKKEIQALVTLFQPDNALRSIYRTLYCIYNPLSPSVEYSLLLTKILLLK